MKQLILTLGLALFLTGCVEEKVVYLNEKGEKIEPPARAIPDWSSKVEEVCIKGVVYYFYSYGNLAGISPKIVPTPLDGGRIYYEKC